MTSEHVFKHDTCIWGQFRVLGLCRYKQRFGFGCKMFISDGKVPSWFPSSRLSLQLGKQSPVDLKKRESPKFACQSGAVLPGQGGSAFFALAEYLVLLPYCNQWEIISLDFSRRCILMLKASKSVFCSYICSAETRAASAAPLFRLWRRLVLVWGDF